MKLQENPAITYSECYTPSILDACCGGKMFWFDKADPNVLFQDRREVETITVGKGRNARDFSCKPDLVADFRDMPYEDETFKLVVFDPPHFTSLGEKSYMGIKYGILNKKTWREDIKKGFEECFRVLQNEGILIFKWNEHDIRLSEILKLCPYRPLFGHPSGKAMKTHWVTFMKLSSYGV
ncbi:MAG: SAM-dependent methyltransferase [Flavobacteriaceae bacterium]|nr:SAM-dependent methyltransferase [Flavobacteriaceae bacterium]